MPLRTSSEIGQSQAGYEALPLGALEVESVSDDLSRRHWGLLELDAIHTCIECPREPCQECAAATAEQVDGATAQIDLTVLARQGQRPNHVVHAAGGQAVVQPEQVGGELVDRT